MSLYEKHCILWEKSKVKTLNKTLNSDDLIQAYKTMLLIRRFEEKTSQLYGMGLIGGFCHLYIGQEAIAAAVKCVMKEQDTIITSYRDHGIMLACNSDPKIVMSELLGKETGSSKGKGGSMHMFNVQTGFYGGHGIVGAQVPLGTGLGLAHKYKNNNSISITMFGDGACNQGQIYESLNIAKLWSLPVLYVIENNKYGMGTPIHKSSAVSELYKIGQPFDIPGKKVEGMNFLTVYQALEESMNTIRQTNTPIILEIETYRYRGHSMSDPGTYRDREEVEYYRSNKDPIILMQKYLIDKNLVSHSDLKEIEINIRNIINLSSNFAIQSKEPNSNELLNNVYK